MHKIKDDPTQYTKVTNLNFQIALLMSMEATEHELELGFRQKINFEFRMIYFGYISEEPQFRLNLG